MLKWIQKSWERKDDHRRNGQITHNRRPAIAGTHRLRRHRPPGTLGTRRCFRRGRTVAHQRATHRATARSPRWPRWPPPRDARDPMRMAPSLFAQPGQRHYRIPSADWSLLRSLLFRGAVKRLDTPRNGQRIGTCRSRSSFKLVEGRPKSGQNPDRSAGKTGCGGTDGDCYDGFHRRVRGQAGTSPRRSAGRCRRARSGRS